MSTPDLKEIVREKYGEAASRVQAGRTSCCGPARSDGRCCDPITSNLYDTSQASEVPEAALQSSLGCGNPTTLAECKPGEAVLDLGSGGGIDVILSARRVGPTGQSVRSQHGRRDACAGAGEQAVRQWMHQPLGVLS